MKIRMSIIIGLCLCALGAGGLTVQAKEKPITVRVLALSFNPIIPEEGNKRLHEVGKWNDPRTLAEGYIQDIKEASGGFIQYKIVEWRDVNTFQTKTDGFVYTAETYMQCFRREQEWHQPDGLDYERMIKDNGIIKLVDEGKIDEVWMFGAPYFGYWESAMAGPGAFYINGGVYEKVKAKRPFAIMGFNYERGVAEMLHDLCHRTESTMSRIYGGWKAEELTSNWARFAANAQQSGGEAAAGTCHYPPNAENDYDYANKRTVMSSADDWMNYPKLTGAKKPVSCETWGGPDYHRNDMKWWFARLPRSSGTHPEDGRLNNWWRYVFEFTKYDERGKPVK